MESPEEIREPARPGVIAVALALLALLLVLIVARLAPPPARPVDAVDDDGAPAISGMRALGHLEVALGDQSPHPIGSPANVAVRQRILGRLRDLGYAPEIQVATGCSRRGASCGRVENIVARAPGQSRRAILLSAHYDSVAAGPGAGDDGSGVATVLEVARILATRAPLRHAVIFLLVDGEEYGLLGSQAFVDAHPWARDVDLALNIDSGGNTGVATFTRTSAGNGPAIAALAGAIARPHAASLTASAYRLTPYDTDFSVYDRAGIFALDLGIGEDKAPYHTPNDRLEDLDTGSLQHLGDTALSTVLALDRLDRGDLDGAGDRVYLDFGGLFLGTSPSWLVAPAAIALAGALVVLFGRVRRRDRSGAGARRAAIAQLLAWPALTLGSLAAATVVAVLLALLARAEAASYAAPVILRVALWSVAFAVSGAIAGAFARRLAPTELHVGVWSWLALLTVACALVDPGASVGLLPALAWEVAIVGLAALVAPARTSLPTWALILTLAMPAWMWMQAALRIELLFGVGRHGAAIALAPVALTAALLAPLWALEPRTLRRIWIAVALALAVVVGGAAALRPAHSESRARRLSVLLYRDADAERSQWIAGDLPGGLPPTVAAAAEFSAPSRTFPWSAEDEESYHAPAVDLPLPGPALEVVSEARGPWGRLLRLHLRSPRGARTAALLFPESAGVRAVAIDGVTLAPYPRRKLEDYPDARHYGVIGLPARGVEVTVMLAAEGPIEVTLWDIADGLPDAPEALALARSRPPDALPTHGGDRSLVSRRQTIE
ncbi:MAG: M20/M25/M40 family metallo-hydrolase [Nannocystaceae bacterium]